MSKITKPLFFLYLVVVMILSTTPAPPPIQTPGDKVNHFIAFVVFAVLFLAAFKDTKPFTVFLWGLAFGILIEAVQSLLPWRSVEIMDVVADAAGLIPGIFLGRYLSRFMGKRESTEDNGSSVDH